MRGHCVERRWNSRKPPRRSDKKGIFPLLHTSDGDFSWVLRQAASERMGVRLFQSLTYVPSFVASSFVNGKLDHS